MKKKLNVNEVLVRLIKLMIQRRPEEITFAFASRHCKIPRSTLYYYFGSNRMDMLTEAIKFGMQIFVQLPQLERYKQCASWQEFEMRRLENALRLNLKYPWAAELFFKFRNNKSVLGETIRGMELQYTSGMEKAWAHFYGRKPQPQSVRFASYMKVGLFFGFSADSALWKSAKEKARRQKFMSRFEALVMELMQGE